ncbi:hypothetical protein [Sporosarcina gallistercoris]|uniref:Uncharacterized protein n=1 Tax=Sporosarcina gallistercoris TaxID=2762245 RepID=A0ABR8PL63_9BACL|nr:hypothetical protein [Sporosarcina gallistercoris]MBD7908902.1 hypothetical protein [Sporosarcina gallistercoris]
MSEIIYKPIMESGVNVSETYSICIDKCIKLENGEEQGEQFVMRYKKELKVNKKDL